jgi:transcriptional regulator with XRE-family HTH domain
MEEVLVIRKRLKLTQAELGKKLGVDRRSIRNWELKGHSPRLRHIKAIQALLAASEKTVKEVDVPPKPSGLLRVEEAATLYHVALKTVYRAIAENRLPAQRGRVKGVHRVKVWLVEAIDMEQFVSERWGVTKPRAPKPHLPISIPPDAPAVQALAKRQRGA